MFAGTLRANIRLQHPAIRNADPGLPNSLVSVAAVGYPAKKQSPSQLKARQHRNGVLGDKEGRVQQRPQPKLRQAGMRRVASIFLDGNPPGVDTPFFFTFVLFGQPYHPPFKADGTSEPRSRYGKRKRSINSGVPFGKGGGVF